MVNRIIHVILPNMKPFNCDEKKTTLFLLKMLSTKPVKNYICLINMYKRDLALNKLYWLKWDYYHHYYHIVSPARISLTLFRHFSLSFIISGRSSGIHPVSSHSCCMYGRAGRPVLLVHMWGYIGVHHL